MNRRYATPPPPPASPTSWARYPFTVWEGERGKRAIGRGYRTRHRAIIAAWWASLYSGHDVWIEHDMPGPVALPTIGPQGGAGDSGAARR